MYRVGMTAALVALITITPRLRAQVNDKQVARGMNSIQAIKTDAGWRVLEGSWQAETPQLQVPKEMLPE